MTPTDGPTRPDDVADVPLRVLAGTYADNMLGWHLFGGKRYTLGVLADGAALTQRIDADRWPTTLAALTEGATLDEVADAMVEHPEDVRIGLTMWAVGQHSEGSISLMRYREIVNLVDVGGEPVGEPGPQ